MHCVSPSSKNNGLVSHATFSPYRQLQNCISLVLIYWDGKPENYISAATLWHRSHKTCDKLTFDQSLNCTLYFLEIKRVKIRSNRLRFMAPALDNSHIAFVQSQEMLTIISVSRGAFSCTIASTCRHSERLGPRQRWPYAPPSGGHGGWMAESGNDFEHQSGEDPGYS